MHNTPSTNRIVSPRFGLHGLIGVATALTTIAFAACDAGSSKPAPVETQVVSTPLSRQASDHLPLLVTVEL